MFPVWASVEVSNPEHARNGQAGNVRAEANEAGEVLVQFDVDSAQELIKTADLVRLG